MKITIEVDGADAEELVAMIQRATEAVLCVPLVADADSARSQVDVEAPTAGRRR